MITIDDLYDWMTTDKEDSIVDGPYDLNMVEFKDFLTNFTEKELKEILRYVCKNNISELNLDDFSIGGGGYSDHLEYKIVSSFVDTLNKYNHPNEF
jgi:hypothetical protein